MGNDEGQGDELIQQQITQNNAEIEQKRQAIAKERFDIVKSQGAPNWTPEPLAKAISPQEEQAKQVEKFKNDQGVRTL